MITSFLTKKWVRYTTVDKIAFVTSEDNVYDRRRVFSKVGGSVIVWKRENCSQMSVTFLEV